MPHIGLVGTLVILGQIVLGTSSGALVLWVQRRFFLHEDEDQSFAIPGTVAFFASLYYFWMVITYGPIS
ncbi:membrane protein [Streptomyces phage Dryad]|nr:membrane protein [Streptomyces phage Dryad]